MLREAADALVRSGLCDAGYVYANIDDGWLGQRHANGVVQRWGRLVGANLGRATGDIRRCCEARRVLRHTLASLDRTPPG